MAWLKYFSTDKIIAIGLVIVLILSLIFGSSSELQTNIAVGLVGFLGRTIIDHGGDDKHGIKKP